MIFIEAENAEPPTMPHVENPAWCGTVGAMLGNGFEFKRRNRSRNFRMVSQWVVFSCVSGRIYRIQSNESLEGGWTDRLRIQADDDGSFELIDTDSAAGKRFYRAVFP